MVDSVSTKNFVVSPPNPQELGGARCHDTWHHQVGVRHLLFHHSFHWEPGTSRDEYFFNPKPRDPIALAGASAVAAMAGRQAVAQRMAAYAAAQAAEEFLGSRAAQAAATRVVASVVLTATESSATGAAVGGAAAALTWGTVATAAAIGLGAGLLIVGGGILLHYWLTHQYDVFPQPQPTPQPKPPPPIVFPGLPGTEPSPPQPPKPSKPPVWNFPEFFPGRSVLDPPSFQLPWGESIPKKNGVMLVTEIGGPISGQLHPTRSQRRREREVARRMREEMEKSSVAIRSSRDWRIFSRLVPEFFPEGKTAPYKRDYFKFVFVREKDGNVTLYIGRIVKELPTGKLKHTAHREIARNTPPKDAIAVGFGGVGPDGELVVFPQQSAYYKDAKTGSEATEAIQRSFDNQISVRNSEISRPMDPRFLLFGEFMNWAYYVPFSE